MMIYCCKYYHLLFGSAGEPEICPDCGKTSVREATEEEQLDFGTWKQIFYGEFDGMRDKRVLAKLVGE